jgi:hypothetical protein
VGDRAAPPSATTDEHVGGPLIEHERVALELAAVAYPGNDDRNVSVDAHVVHLGGHELVTDTARFNGLEELLPGEDPVLADEHPVRLGKGSDRFGSLATTAWFQSAISAEKTSKVVLLLLSVMPEAYGLAPH